MAERQTAGGLDFEALRRAVYVLVVAGTILAIIN